MLAPRTDLIRIARVLKANGTDGAFVMGLHGVDAQDLNLEEPVFIYFDGSPVPFFIESMTPRGLSKAVVKLTGIRSLEDVEEIAGADIWVEVSSLPGGDEEEDLSLLEGWTLYDCNPDGPAGEPEGSSAGRTGTDASAVDGPAGAPDGGSAEAEEDLAVDGGAGDFGAGERPARKVGKIVGFADIPGNPCIEVETKNGVVMVPLHEDLIESLDQDSQVIVMNIPSGLI